MKYKTAAAAKQCLGAKDQPKSEPEKIKLAEVYPILATHWPDFLKVARHG